MRRVKSLFHIFIISLFLFNGFSSCALFENDVADFMEKYTETAAIEQHTFSIETYTDAANQLCIPSDQDVEITFYMRNPKQFSLVPSANFDNLDGQLDRSAVSIEQTDFATIILSLPQDFLIPADEGKDITPLINLYEPMSGRDFDRYSVSLSCNSKPPAILNPTILNKGNQTFVVAFDMPNEEEVAIRHKDLASVEINGVSYPVQVTTETDSTSDPEHPNLQVARYTFTDAHFKRSYSSSYITLKGKTFEHKANNSVYFETDDAFTNGDKEYSIILRDSAGLTSEVKASTSISKLVKPEILDRDGAPIAEGVLAAAPYDEDTEKGVITIIPPTEDHLGNPVSGTTVYYKVYEATGSGRIYTSGTTTTAKTIELPQNTYRVEAYATLTNYENSATNTVKFRFMNSVIYVEAVTSPSASNASNLTTGDGSIAAPFPTIADVIEDINRNRTGNDRKPKYTIYIKGDFTSTTYGMQNPTAPHDYGSILLDSIETDELIFKKWQGASEAKLTGINVAPTSTLQKVTIGDITVTNSGGDGITHSSSNTLIIDGTTITGFGHAIQQSAGYLTIKNCNISNNNIGLNVDDCTRCDVQGGVFESNNSNAIYYKNVSGTCTISGGTIKNSISTGGPGIVIENSTCTISGVTITNCDAGGIGLTGTSTLNLSGGTITGNKPFGINVNSDSTLKIHGNPKVTGNTVSGGTSPANVIITKDKTITIDGPFTAGARIGVTTHTDNEPTAIGQTYPFANDYTNSGSPSQYFTSDRGFSIVGGSGGSVCIAKSGSSGGQYLATDYNFTFAASSNGSIPGQTKAMTITPTITRTEPGSTPAINITYASIADDVTWSVLVKNGGTQVASFTSNSFTFPAVPEGNYKLLVTATYLGQPHGAEFDIAVNNSAENVAAYISSLTTAGTYNVVVEGPVGASTTPGSEGGLAKVANAIRSLTSGTDRGVRINLDARATINSDFIGNYNNGMYFNSCRALASIALPDWMEYLITELFSDCDGLESIEIPDTVQLIMTSAFDGCSSLTEITLPATISGSGDDHGIEEDAFYRCTSLATINFTGTMDQWKRTRREVNWHRNVPATVVHCVDGDCGLDSILPLTGGVTVLGFCPVISMSQVLTAERGGVIISNLWVSDHETTQAEYVAVMGINPSSFNGSSGKEPDSGEIQENRPVENVSWYDVLVYCNKRSMAEGLTPCYTMKKASAPTVDSTDPDDWGTVPTSSDTRWDAVTCNFNANGYRLPTEAEWEYCARGGDIIRDNPAVGETWYCGTSDESDLKNYAWYNGTANVNSKTHEIRKKRPNIKELYDMNGNVAEWCWDWYSAQIDTYTPATGWPSGTERVNRGDSWNDSSCDLMGRDSFPPYAHFDSLGFRVVRTIP